ncbi:MAG: LysR family transcriptional regulator [Polyangiaceae bacterium]|jgi:LysR family glycine cleavage system transcriptional activator|nr:LysR family transcriptional regulator [Polyangiaceae bacterium]
MHLPDIESLRCFAAAAHHGSFRRAASEVGLSPAAFSDRIRRLEEQLGERLFVRTTRSCRLSKAGERALPHAKLALDAARRCLLASSDAPPPYDLVLGTRFELGMSWVVPSLEALEAKAPERRLHLYFGDSDALLSQLFAGRVDAVITSVRLSHPGVETASLHEETYALVAAPRLLGERPLSSCKDAAVHTLLDAHADLPLFRYFIDGRPAREVWRFSAIRRLGTIGAVKALTLRGQGIAVLPRYFVEAELSARQLVEPLPKARLASDYFRLVWRSGHPRGDDLAQLASELMSLPLR